MYIWLSNHKCLLHSCSFLTTSFAVLYAHSNLHLRFSSYLVLVLPFSSTVFVPKIISIGRCGFLPNMREYGLKSVTLFLVQLYACTNISICSLQVLLGFSGNLPNIFISDIKVFALSISLGMIAWCSDFFTCASLHNSLNRSLSKLHPWPVTYPTDFELCIWLFVSWWQ